MNTKKKLLNNFVEKLANPYKLLQRDISGLDRYNKFKIALIITPWSFDTELNLWIIKYHVFIITKVWENKSVSSTSLTGFGT